MCKRNVSNCLDRAILVLANSTDLNNIKFRPVSRAKLFEMVKTKNVGFREFVYNLRRDSRFTVDDNVVSLRMS